MTDSDSRRREVKRDLKAVEDLLREWDPLEIIEVQREAGIDPSDEYDFYAPRIISLLEKGGTEDDLRALLDHVEAYDMGGGWPDKVRNGNTARKIMEWWKARG